MTPPVVSCREVSRTHGSGATAVTAVSDATCALGPGAQVAITGPSGSGKSSLLHLLAGLDQPSTGQVDRADDVRVGVVFQGPSLVPTLTARENVVLALLLAGYPRADADPAATEALDRVGVGALGGALPQELSGGQAQRVAIARALAPKPALLLADEPTGQLDRRTADQVVTTLLDTTRDPGDPVTLVVATHDPLVAARFRDHWTMRDGRLSTDQAEVPQ